MSKLIDYPAATRFDSGDILIKDGMNGTKKITAKNAAIDLAGMQEFTPAVLWKR